MTFPKHFDIAPRIRLYDPLAELLGSAEAGLLDYSYKDAVAVAGHSCGTVAGAWLMLAAGLEWLYGDNTAHRGNLEVYLRDSVDHGVTGVVALIATYVTGAAGQGGFAGIGEGHLHSRRNLLHFDAPIDTLMGLRRRDTGAGVLLDIDTGQVPHDPDIFRLMNTAKSKLATVEQRRDFAALWQDRVHRMMERHDDPSLVHVYDWPAD